MFYSRSKDVFACALIVGVICFYVLGSLGLDVISIFLAIMLAICTAAARIMHFIEEDKKKILEEIRKSRGE